MQFWSMYRLKFYHKKLTQKKIKKEMGFSKKFTSNIVIMRYICIKDILASEMEQGQVVSSTCHNSQEMFCSRA